VSLLRGDGDMARSGGKVVKNVAGFDLPKVICGSLGSLGLIGRVTLRLHPLPEATSTLLVRAVSGPQVLELMRALRQAQLEPCAGVVLWRSRDTLPELALSFEGFGRAVQHQAERLQRLAREQDLVCDELGAPQALALWARHDVVRRCPSLRVRIATLPSRIATLQATLEPLFEVLADAALAFYPALGLGFAAGVPIEAEPTIAALESVRATLLLDGGSLVIETAPPALAEVNPWGPLPAGFEIMRQLKQRFDPDRRLNPGRFVGGL
jgi:glycolate oxidase FAD binding subunit